LIEFDWQGISRDGREGGEAREGVFEADQAEMVQFLECSWTGDDQT
jgi:hypothetical protein